MNPHDSLPPRLTPDDKRILDALAEAHFNLDAMESLSTADYQRAQALLRLLGLMNDYPVSDADEPLLQATLDCLKEHGIADSSFPGTLKLSTEDAAAVDALLEHGLNPNHATHPVGVDENRTRSLQSLLATLDDYPVEEVDETLLHATLARIDHYEDQRRTRLKLTPQEQSTLRGSHGFRLRLPNFITAAAIILLLASVALPILNQVNQQQKDRRSQHNLQYVSQAVDSYANDFGGSIPIARAGFDRTLSRFTDAINLTPLVERNYCQINAPEQPRKQPVMPARWGESNMVLYMDKGNTIINALQQGHMNSPLTIMLTHDSPQHHQLRPDGAILWLNDPLPQSDVTLWRAKGLLWLQDEIKPATAQD